MTTALVITMKSLSVDTPSKTSWEDDDITPLKRSAWDLPTPSSSHRDQDQSVRSNVSTWSRKAGHLGDRRYHSLREDVKLRAIV